MIITKKTESLFEIEFDENEQQVLSDMETIFETQPVDMIQRSLDESIRNMAIGTSNLVSRITEKLNRKDS